MKVVPRSSRRTRTSISRRRRVLRGRRARATPLREFHQHSGPRDDEVGSEDGDGDGRELQRPDYGIRRSPCAGPSVTCRNATLNGTGLFQVTHTPGVDNVDWGTHPPTG